MMLDFKLIYIFYYVKRESIFTIKKKSLIQAKMFNYSNAFSLSVKECFPVNYLYGKLY